jgi:hypothetical protein
VSLLGIHLTLLIGTKTPAPAPADLTEALVGVTVSHNAEGRSGFSLTFQVGRSGPLDMLDYPFLRSPLLRAFNRVILVLRFDVRPRVLMDGIITSVQLSPSNEPGASTLTVMGEDVSVMLGRMQLAAPWPSMTDDEVVLSILAKYPDFGFIPSVLPPVYPNAKSPTEQITVQTETDLDYVNSLAARSSYVFYVDPGPSPGSNYAYWGPPRVPPPYRAGLIQKSITFNAGPESNAESLSTTYNALSATLVAGVIQDAQSNQTLPIITTPLGMRVPLSSMPALAADAANVRVTTTPSTPERLRQLLDNDPEGRESARRAEGRAVTGVDYAEALARAQATTDASTDNVVTVQGELDALQYGSILQSRALVGVRGVGFSYGGNYFVKSVTHDIKRGQYKQSFTLAREGTGSLTTTVAPS